MIPNQKNILSLLIAKNGVARSSMTDGTSYPQYLYNAGSLTTGEIFVVDQYGKYVNRGSSLPSKFKVGYVSGNAGIVWSDLIDATTVKNYRIKYSVADADQVYYIGYNGTNEAIDVLDNNLYFSRFNMLGVTTQDFMRQELKYASYTSGDTATQYDVAENFVIDAIANFALRRERDIKFEVVSSATTVAINNSVVEITFTYGSKYAKANTDHADLTAGNYLRVGHATAKTYALYRIVSNSSGVLELAIPYQGADAVIAHGSIGFCSAATAQAADFGAKCTGRVREFEAGRHVYTKARFDIGLQGFGTTVVTKTTEASEGLGLGKQVAEFEWHFQSNDGNIYRSDSNAPLYNLRADAITANYYTTLSLDFSDNQETVLGSAQNSPKQLMIALDHSTSVGASAPSTVTGATTVGSSTDTLSTGFAASNGAVIVITAAGSSGLTVGKAYYVVGVSGSSTCQLALTVGGSAIDLTSSSSDVSYVYYGTGYGSSISDTVNMIDKIVTTYATGQTTQIANL